MPPGGTYRPQIFQLRPRLQPYVSYLQQLLLVATRLMFDVDGCIPVHVLHVKCC